MTTSSRTRKMALKALAAANDTISYDRSCHIDNAVGEIVYTLPTSMSEDVCTLVYEAIAHGMSEAN